MVALLWFVVVVCIIGFIAHKGGVKRFIKWTLYIIITICVVSGVVYAVSEYNKKKEIEVDYISITEDNTEGFIVLKNGSGIFFSKDKAICGIDKGGVDTIKALGGNGELHTLEFDYWFDGAIQYKKWDVGHCKKAKTSSVHPVDGMIYAGKYSSVKAKLRPNQIEEWNKAFSGK